MKENAGIEYKGEEHEERVYKKKRIKSRIQKRRYVVG